MGLRPLPPTFAATRAALHRVAEEVVAPARKPDNEIALMRTPGGFGTPEFEHEGRRLRVRVEGAELVVEEDGAQRRAAIDSLAGASRFVGTGLYFDGTPSDESALDVDAEAAAVLAEVYALGETVLAGLVAEASPADEASAVNLWPEHFDIAIESGPQQLGRRATFGFSPGDENHPEPYAYVGPWTPQSPGELWNATGFAGAELGYAQLAEAGDPAALAADFFEVRREALEG